MLFTIQNSSHRSVGKKSNRKLASFVTSPDVWNEPPVVPFSIACHHPRLYRTVIWTRFLAMIRTVKNNLPETRAFFRKCPGRRERKKEAGVAHGSYDNRCDYAIPQHRQQHRPNIRQGTHEVHSLATWPPGGCDRNKKLQHATYIVLLVGSTSVEEHQAVGF